MKAHHLVVLVHTIVAVHHVLAQVWPKKRPHNDLTEVGTKVQGLCKAQQSGSGWRCCLLAVCKQSAGVALGQVRRYVSINSPRTFLGTLLSSGGHGCQPLSLMARKKKLCGCQAGAVSVALQHGRAHIATYDHEPQKGCCTLLCCGWADIDT